jgi:acetyl-CoA C-acetyltransferase
VVAADLADEAPDLIGAITALADPFAPRHYPQSAITAHAFQAAAYMARNRLCERDMAHVIVKNRANGVDNEFAQLRQAVTIEDVLASPLLSWPIKRLEASPRSSGAAAVVVGPSAARGARRAVVATGFGSFANHGHAGARMVPGVDESYFDAADLAAAARRAYRMAGIDDPAADLDLAEVYASFGIIELLSIEGLGLTRGGNAARMIGDGHFRRDAELPVNASGGATCGTPISATGLIRVIECVLQLRGEAGARQLAKTPHRAVAAAIGGLFQLHDIAVLEA